MHIYIYICIYIYMYIYTHKLSLSHTHEPQVWGVAYNPSGTKFVSIGDDGSVLIGKKEVQPFPVFFLTKFVSIGDDCSVLIGKKEVQPFPVFFFFVCAHAYIAQSTKLASIVDDGSVFLGCS
jgi:hypothetical protein